MTHTGTKPDSEFDAPERIALYDRARESLNTDRTRRNAVADIRHYQRKPTACERAIAQRKTGETADRE